jgi:hypothetical protein
MRKFDFWQKFRTTPSSAANMHRKLDVSFALRSKIRFTMPSILDKGICGTAMAT